MCGTLMQITLVGKIIQASEQPTHLQFQLDDGTGKIELSYWTSDDDQDMVRTCIQQSSGLSVINL